MGAYLRIIHDQPRRQHPFVIVVGELRRRGTSKWSSYGDDVLAAWVAEMDFPLAAPLRVALHAAIEQGETGYAPVASSVPAACAAWNAITISRHVPNIAKALTQVVRKT